MNYSLLIEDRYYAKKTFECAPLTISATLSTRRTGAPASLKFDLMKAGDLSFGEGDPVRFSVDGTVVFYGYVFTKEKDRWGKIAVTAYDQMRYLLANQAYRCEGYTAEGIIRRVAGDFELTVGALEQTGYVIPYLDSGGKSCLDFIQLALQQVTVNTGKVFVFYDDCGKLSLREAGNWKSDVVIGEKSLATGYTYKTDIDSDTYNCIKLVRPNGDTGKGDVYEERSGADIARWGLLQYYKQVDENLNPAQIVEQAKTLLAYYDRVLRTLTVEALGVPGLRAGQMVFLNIPELGDISLSKYVMLESVEHTFEQERHVMKLETRPLNGW